MGNCQCQSEIHIPVSKNEIVTKSIQLRLEQLKKLVRLQAVIRGFLVRRKHDGDVKCSRTTEQKHSSSIDYIQASKSFNKHYVPALRQQASIEVGQSESALNLSSNRVFDKSELKITVNEVLKSEVSSHSEQSKKLIINMTGIIFEARKPSDTQLIRDSIDQQIKLPMIKMKNGGLYEGQWLNRKAHGFGRYILLDQSFYIGDWIDGKVSGIGTFQHPDGDTYRGQWKYNMVNGKGKYTFADGTYYDGEWLNDQFNGKGLQTYRDGSCYEGTFVKGLKHGFGKLSLKDGSIYTGEFDNDMIHGQGTLVTTDGCVYEGEWKKNQKNGKGIFDWPDGRKYDGYYVNDQKEGFGIFYWASGQKYIGLWKDGLMHGNGQIIKEGIQIRGKWVKGELQQRLLSTQQQSN